jgi:hypothetical protein
MIVGFHQCLWLILWSFHGHYLFNKAFLSCISICHGGMCQNFGSVENSLDSTSELLSGIVDSNPDHTNNTGCSATLMTGSGFQITIDSQNIK